MDATPLQGAKIVVAGVTGQVAEPLAGALARHNEVVGAARFTDPEARQRLEDAGVRCVAVDLAEGEVSGLPADADYVLNFAVTKTNNWDFDLQANCGGVPCTFSAQRGTSTTVYANPTPNAYKEFRQDDIKVLDLRIEKTVNFGHAAKVRLFGDIYNITNAYAAETITQATGTAFQQPTAILGPRTGRIGFRFLW